MNIVIQNVSIKGFRCFDSFELKELTRINLFVGKNEAGKTSVLEAISLLLDTDPIMGLIDLADARTERVIYTDDDSYREKKSEYLIGTAFHGYVIKDGSAIEISANDREKVLSFKISPINVNKNIVDISGHVFKTKGFSTDYKNITVAVDEHIKKIQIKPESYAIASDGSVELDEEAIRRRAKNKGNMIPPFQFLSSHRLAEGFPVDFWNRVLLTPDEDLVESAMQLIDPNIDRIALISNPQKKSKEEIIYVKLKGNGLRVPLGTFGDGIYQLFLLALYSINTKKGYLFIDEIDSGLHYSVLMKMWRFLIDLAKQHDIQVFATTHSSDCIDALARLHREDKSIQDIVSLHRIDNNEKQSSRYSAEEIDIAGRHGMDLR